MRMSLVQLYSMKIKLTHIEISFNLILYSFKFVKSLGFELDTMLVSSSLIHPESSLPLVSPDHRPRHKNRDHHSQEISFLFQAPLELWERNLAAHTQTISKYFWQNKLKECVQKAVVVLLEPLRPPNIGMSVSFLWARGRRQVKESGGVFEWFEIFSKGCHVSHDTSQSVTFSVTNSVT